MKEEDKWHPLVIGLVGDIVFIRIEVSNTGLNCFNAYLRAPMLGQSESGQDVAISVYDILRNGPRIHGARQYTRDFAAVANPFQAGDECATGKKYQNTGPVVQTINNALCRWLTELVKSKNI